MFFGAVMLSDLLIVPLTGLLFCDRRFGVTGSNTLPPAVGILLGA
jgi:hypothetical protein